MNRDQTIIPVQKFAAQLSVYHKNVNSTAQHLLHLLILSYHKNSAVYP